MSKFNKALSGLIISFLATSFLPMMPAYGASKTPIFKPSRAGRISTVVSNTILNGVTPPKSSDGIVGDFYIDTKAMLFYGPKTKTHWPSPTSIRGPQGQSGPSGSNGSDAKPSANVVAAGAQGLTGATGPRGEPGAQGFQGVAGPSGAKGETGAIGPAGSSGTPGFAGTPGSTGAQGPAGPQGVSGNSGANGSVGPAGSPGSTGLAGSSGAVGATGPAGATGPSGATGPAGISNATYGAISFASQIQGVVGTAQTSSNFGTFGAGKSYVVRIQIQTFNVDRLISSYPLALDVSTPGASPSRSVSYVVANGSSFNLSTRRDEVSITAEVVLDGSQIATAYALSATVTCGSNTGSFPLTLQGRYHAVVVGQVTQTS